MTTRTGRWWGLIPLAAGALSVALPLAAAEAPTDTGASSSRPASASAPAAQSSEIEQLKAMLAEQQRQINELRKALEQKAGDSAPAATAQDAPASVAAKPNLGQVASTTAIVPLGTATSPVTTVAFTPAPQAAPAAAPDAIQKAIDAINSNLRGFRLSGDLRFRTDLQVRSGNPNFTDNRGTPLQRARERYRFRFNLDKDVFYKDGDRAMASFHVQLATDPFNNPSTMDTDFSGISTRAPISVSEAYADFRPIKSLTLRVGRTPELYADNRQFVYDDDIRFNGFHETYRWNGKSNGFYIQIAAAQYILTDPNTPSVPAGSAFNTTLGYGVGQHVPAAGLFDQGITVGSNLGKKWSHNETFNFFAVREPNQIQFASTAGGAALFATSPVVGATLTGNLPETGNATTTSGGAIYYANGFEVLKGAVNLNYSGSTFMKHNYPFALFLQATHNTQGRGLDETGYMLGASWGQAARLGDIQLQYQYFYKPANAFVSQFTDDDIGSGSGVNLKGHELRVNFGLTRFLAWENRLYIQKGIGANGPGFFVPFQAGYNIQYRWHSQFVFSF